MKSAVRGNRLLPSEDGGHGGGVTIAGADCRIEDCVIADNRVEAPSPWPTRGYETAGGLYLTTAGKSAVVRRTVIQDNYSAYGDGGGVYVPGLNAASAPLFENVLVCGNSTETGYSGGVYGKATAARFVHCTVSGNSAGSSTRFKAHGVYLENAPAVFTNSVVSGNGPAGTRFASGNFLSTSAAASLVNSCVSSESEATNCAVAGCVYGDPGFVDAANGDFSLRLDSVCRNTGVDAGVTDDLAGALRPQETGFDMGCYEAAAPTEHEGVFRASAMELPPAGGEVTFTATATFPDDVVGYEWTIAGADGTTVLTNTTAVYARTFSDAGAYAVSLRILWPGDVVASAGSMTILVHPATTYVAANGGSVAPYATAATAATNIQDAVDAVYATADAPGRVEVAPGIYGAAAGRAGADWMVTISKPVLLYGTGTAPQETVIDGEDARRILSVTAAGTVVSNLTLVRAKNLGSMVSTRGYAADLSAGLMAGCVVSNCLSAVNNANCLEHAVCVQGGAVADGDICCNRQGSGNHHGTTLYVTSGSVARCRVFGNRVSDKRGGAVVLDGAVLFEDCEVSGNTATYSEYGDNPAGGVSIRNGATMRRCRIVGNDAAPQNAQRFAGGVSAYGDTSSLIENCVISNNSSARGGGWATIVCGGLLMGPGTVARNCLVVDNRITIDGSDLAARVTSGGVLFSGATQTVARLENCTVYGNSDVTCAALSGVYLNLGALTNCVVWGNGVVVDGTTTNALSGRGPSAEGYVAGNITNVSGTVGYTCTAPLVAGDGNIAADPVLLPGFTLRSNSPCIGKGLNEDWMTGATDLAGNPRIQGRTVDLGCNESAPAMGFSIRIQ